jgi:hypothetical protein
MIGDRAPVETLKMQMQLVVTTPVFYHLEKRENDDSSVGYIRIRVQCSVKKKIWLVVCTWFVDLIFCRFFLFHNLDAVL